ncbi:hypothetical protein H4R33_001923 [Dimargaris cristalligena]|nr:hypothetical protein H4R33_001923 [Dimargaris cristalligena]
MRWYVLTFLVSLTLTRAQAKPACQQFNLSAHYQQLQELTQKHGCSAVRQVACQYSQTLSDQQRRGGDPDIILQNLARSDSISLESATTPI